MKIHDEYLSDEVYSQFLAHMPQVCVELVVETDGKVLLCKRENKPAKHEWFWPGSRLYKGETFEEAVHRIAKEELGITVAIQRWLGVYAHFWETSAFDNVDSTHTVNIVYLVSPKEEIDQIELDAQHSAYKFISDIQPHLHKYVKLYLRDHKLIE